MHYKGSISGNPKTLTPCPRTPTTDRVHRLPTDRSTNYPYGPPTDHPQNRIKNKNKHITYSFSVSGQLAPKTIRPGRLAPESTNLTMFLLFVFYRGFLRTIQYYVLVVYFLQRFLRCVEIKVFNFEVKAKERLVGSVEMQSEICERRWSVLLEQNDHM